MPHTSGLQVYYGPVWPELLQQIPREACLKHRFLGSTQGGDSTGLGEA